MPEDIKLVTETKKGTLLKVPATIERDAGRIYFTKSPFALKDEIKSMKGSKYHGYIEGDGRKIWSVDDCTRNNFQLEFMMGENPYANWDKPLKKHVYSRSLFDHQYLMSDTVLTYHYTILAAEMGCVSGDAVVHCNRAGRGFQITLEDLYNKWMKKKNHKGKLGQKSWDSSIPTYVRSMKEDELGLHRLVNVIDKGRKNTIKIILKSGKELICTPDHEIYVDKNTCIPAEDLKTGDSVLTNGSWVDKDGYVRVGGLKDKHPRWTTGGVYEHILIMEQHLGRYIEKDEIVHHKNGVRHDNRIENLELISNASKHSKHHGQVNFVNLQDENKVWFVPKFDTVKSIEENGKTRVFDLVMDDPYRNFVANGFVVHNCGKTLSAIEAMEQSGVYDWWWVGPKSALASVEREFKKWGLKIQPKIMTYDRLRIDIERWEKGAPAPQGVIFDESSRLKSSLSKRTKAAQHLADSIRNEWGWDGFVVLMSGTPSPKSPVDWFSQAEICYPGFIREGTVKAFERRLAIFEKQEGFGQGPIWTRVTWKDDENKCGVCGQYEEHENHQDDIFGGDTHQFKPSKNEVSYLYERLKGLVLPLSKKDCLDIPEKNYREIVLEPSPTIKRVAKALANSAESTIQGLTWLRELSDGFQYKETQRGVVTCPVCYGEGKCKQWDGGEKVLQECACCDGSGVAPNMVRETKEIKTPKDTAVRDLLEENEDQGRILIFAGFQGSIDRIVNICHKQQWNVVKVDGRGWKVLPCDDTKTKVKPLDYWADMDINRVAFVAHPTSGGMGLTLTEARTAVFYSNDFNPESRSQAEDRIHRPGIDENRGATIIDLFHLGTDRKVRDVLIDNRRLETMTLGEMRENI